MARPGEELEIRCTAVQLSTFSEKSSASDAICWTSSASPSRNSPSPQSELSSNSPFPQFELTLGDTALWQSNASRGVSAAGGVPAGIQSSFQLLELILGSLESSLGFVKGSFFTAAPQLPDVQQFGCLEITASPTINGCPSCLQTHGGF